MPKLHLRDIDINYDRRGAGPRVLFIAGTAGDLRNKPGTLDGPWPRHFDTLVFDQRGLGQSSKPDKPYTMGDYAEDAAALIRAVGWPSARVIGVSFGGMVALELAVRHPDLIERLVLACTSPGGAGGSSYPLHEIQHMAPAERARHMISISDTRNDASWMAAHPRQVDEMVGLAINDPYADEPGRATGARRQLEARAGHDVWDRLDRITAPTLIAAGRYDVMARPDSQENMKRRITGAELRFFEGGHMFMNQDPAAVPAIIRFLEAR